MKKSEQNPGMKDEYDFSGGERGRYTAMYAEGSNVVVLDPDVAAEFKSPEAVNDALREELQRRRASGDAVTAGCNGHRTLRWPVPLIPRIRYVDWKIAQMSLANERPIGEWTIRHFSGKPSWSGPKRSSGITQDVSLIHCELGNVEVQDLVLHNEVTAEGTGSPSLCTSTRRKIDSGCHITAGATDRRLRGRRLNRQSVMPTRCDGGR